MEAERNEKRTGEAGGAESASTNDPSDFLKGVRLSVGEKTDAYRASPWPGRRDRLTTRETERNAALRDCDHVEFGKLVADWAADPASRPADVAELRSQIRGIATLSDSIERVRFVEDAPGTLTVRLPRTAALERGLDECTNPARGVVDPIPRFYSDNLRPGIAPVLTHLNLFLARLGDLALGTSR